MQQIAGRNEGKCRKRGAGNKLQDETNCRKKRGEIQETRCWKQIAGQNELQEETRGNTGNEVLETNCRTKRIAGRNEGKYRKRGRTKIGAGNELQEETRKLQENEVGAAGNAIAGRNEGKYRRETSGCWKQLAAKLNCRKKRGKTGHAGAG